MVLGMISTNRPSATIFLPMNIVRRTLDIDTDARLREMADERGQDVAAVLAEAVALLDSVGRYRRPRYRRGSSAARRLQKDARCRAAGRRQSLGDQAGVPLTNCRAPRRARSDDPAFTRRR
jgi:hypothetical protein